jgi:hypothetical protein
LRFEENPTSTCSPDCVKTYTVWTGCGRRIYERGTSDDFAVVSARSTFDRRRKPAEQTEKILRNPNRMTNFTGIPGPIAEKIRPPARRYIRANA